MSQKGFYKEITMPDGKKVTIETGRLAKQADGSVVVKVGDMMLLATVVSNKEAKEGVDFMPLTVDYQEKFASIGRIPGSFQRREGRLSDYEILISRLIDRALRPLFPEDYHADTQVMVSLISGDKEIQPDCYAALAASAAIQLSDVPFNGPMSEVRVGKVDGKLIVNPSTTEIEQSTIDMVVAGSIQGIVMVEGEMSEISEDEMLEAILFAHEAIKVQCNALLEFEKELNKTTKRTYSHETHDLALKEELHKLFYDKVYAIAKQGNPNKHERSDAFKKLLQEYKDALPEDTDKDLALVDRYYHEIEWHAVRDMTLKERHRLDNRKADEIRPIWCEVGYLPSAHGSAIFTRGETQSLTTVTLGTKLDEQLLDSPMLSGTSKFMLHYNFPGFSTGEAKPNRGAGRREIGHGNLALRALKKVMPTGNDNPYTIRIVSDILESNGSSSMATVCAGTLALMDSGLKITAPVSGIAMGLIKDSKSDNYIVLSDILGDEDHLGDMDFKVTGTSKGITACQMDLKITGLSSQVMKEALEQARKGRLHILGEITKVISEPRDDFKPFAPRCVNLVIDKDFIGAVIGPGGKVIQEMQRITGATIVIEEVDNKGIVNIFATNKESLDGAVNRVKAIAASPEINEVYTGKVKSIMPYGAFVEFMPGKDGLLHISEVKWERLETLEGVLTEGEEIQVKLIDIDKKTGKFKLSRKVLIPQPEKKD